MTIMTALHAMTFRKIDMADPADIRQNEALEAAAEAERTRHEAVRELVRNEVAIQVGPIAQHVSDLERNMNDKFQEGSNKMKEFVTKVDFERLMEAIIDPKTGLSKLADKNDVMLLNRYVQNFTLAAQILSTGGRWVYRAIIAIAVLLGAWSIITGGFKDAGTALIHWFIPTP